MQWIKFTVTTTTEGSELVASLLSDYGSEGVSIVDNNDVVNLIKQNKNWDYIDDKLLNNNDKRVFVSGYFDEKFDASQLRSDLELLKQRSVFPMGAMETSEMLIDSQDWENEWRKYYVPLKVGKVVIVPAWQKYSADKGEIPVYIEPGMAFGTGNHETTSMCIELLQDTDLSGRNVADIGCGSGILGTVALALGAKKCWFNDIDEQAIKATEGNLELNNCTSYKLVCGDLDVGNQKFDVVVANLTADLLLRLKEKLSLVCKKGGTIIVSGIINARAEEIMSCFSKDMKVNRIIKKGEWQAMMFEVL